MMLLLLLALMALCVIAVTTVAAPPQIFGHGNLEVLQLRAIDLEVCSGVVKCATFLVCKSGVPTVCSGDGEHECNPGFFLKLFFRLSFNKVLNYLATRYASRGSDRLSLRAETPALLASAIRALQGQQSYRELAALGPQRTYHSWAKELRGFDCLPPSSSFHNTWQTPTRCV